MFILFQSLRLERRCPPDLCTWTIISTRISWEQQGDGKLLKKYCGAQKWTSLHRDDGKAGLGDPDTHWVLLILSHSPCQSFSIIKKTGGQNAGGKASLRSLDCLFPWERNLIDRGGAGTINISLKLRKLNKLCVKWAHLSHKSPALLDRISTALSWRGSSLVFYSPTSAWPYLSLILNVLETKGTGPAKKKSWDLVPRAVRRIITLLSWERMKLWGEESCWTWMTLGSQVSLRPASSFRFTKLTFKQWCFQALSFFLYWFSNII